MKSQLERIHVYVANSSFVSCTLWILECLKINIMVLQKPFVSKFNLLSGWYVLLALTSAGRQSLLWMTLSKYIAVVGHLKVEYEC